MANIGELTVGLRFVPDDASMQQAVRQSQQSLSKGLIAKLTLDDTEFQQTAQKSIAQNRQLERQANEERRAERQRYMNFWKQSLSEQDAAEKRQAQANREAAAEKKRAANDYATFWKQALREQEQAEKAAARAAIQAAREKEAEEKRAYQEGMQRLRNANQTAILNGRLASEARRAEQRAVDDVVRALANQQAAQRNLWQAGKLLTVDLIEGQRALQKEALDTAKTFGTQTNEYRKLTQVAAAAQRTMDQATGKITPGGFGHNVVLGLQNSGLFNQIAALGGPAGQTLGIVASGFSTARKTALEFSGATNTAATAAGFLTGGLTALGVAAVGVAGGLTHLASTGMQELKTLQGGLNVLTASGVENLTGFRQNLNQMKEDLGKVGQGLSTADLTASAGELVKANLSVTDSLKVLAPAAKLAAAENTNLNDTSAQLLMNTRQYGLGVEMVGNVADMLAKAGNLAAGTANDLSLGLGKVGGTGMQAGIQLNDLLGMLVELDLKGMSAADTGADALRTALSSLADPSEKAKGILAELNIELEDSEGKARPAGAIMAELGEKMRGMGIKVNASTGELTGNGEALRTVAGLMDTRAAAAVINLTGEWRTHGQAIKNSQGYLTEYANTMTTGVEPAQRRLQTAWKDAGLAFVEGFANPIADFLDHRATPFIESLGQIFTKLGQIKDFGQLQVELKIKDTDGGLTILGKLLGGGLAAVGQSAKGWMDFGSDVDLRRRLVNAGVMTMARTPGEDWNQLQQIRSDPAGWAKRLEDALAANTKAAEKNGDALLNTVNTLPGQLMPAPNTVNLGTGLPRGDTLSKMNPEFQRLMGQLMVEYITSNPQGLAPYIHEGFRTVERQNALYAQGRTKPGQIVTNAKGGQSIHNYGVAADIYWRDPKTGKVVSFNDPRAIEAAKALGQLATAKGLLWGGTPGWGGPVDMPHIQENISWQDAQKKYGPPGTVNTSVSPKVNPPTPTDPNAKLKKALEEGQHLINQYRLAVASGNDVWKAKVNEAIDAFKKKNKAAWKEYADDYAAISKKGQAVRPKPQKPEETDLQREQRLRREQVALQKLQADIRNADADRLKKIIGTGVTANNSLQKINLAEDELKRRGELEEKQRQQAKAAREKAAKEDAVDRERLLAQRKADGERDIKATIELAKRRNLSS